MERSNISERFIEMVDFLGLTDYQVCKELNLDKSFMSKIRNGKQNASIQVINAFLNTYPDIDANYIFRGTNKMKPAPITEIFHPKSEEKIYDEQSINLYDIEAAANLQTLLANKDQNIIGQIVIPEIPKCDGAVRVKGDSMYPLLKSGDIIGYKEVPADLMHIYWGEMYLVSIDMDGEEYLTVKYIQQSERGEDWIKLVSYNPHHQPKDFPISAIRAIALVKLSIRLNTMK